MRCARGSPIACRLRNGPVTPAVHLSRAGCVTAPLRPRFVYRVLAAYRPSRLRPAYSA